MRPDLPTGVVALLFTDIEGSTRLLAELRGGYIDALAEHRRVIREAVAPHGAGGALISGPRDQTRPTACRR